MSALEQADTVIIGAGVVGLAIAYHLARGGMTNVLVVDRGYLCGGASGRNGGGIRAQWSSEANIVLMQESIRMCRDFAHEMKINVWFRQGGYLFLARTEETRRTLEASVKLQNECGLDTHMLTAHEAQKIVPELDTHGVVAASFNASDGVVFPWPFVWGYAQAARRLGVRIQTFTDVIGFETRGERIEGVVLRDASAQPSHRKESWTVRTHKVINAAGAWSPEIARMLGVDLPNRPHRHEICSTEPLKPWLKPLVADLGDGLYFSQSMRGEIVGGIGQDNALPGINQESSHPFLGRYSQSLLRACPVLGGVKVLRQWAGCYDKTPDSNPIVGEVDGIEHFYQASGFVGHGFMMAPVVGKQIAEAVIAGKPSPTLKAWNLRRFQEGTSLQETMIIG